jgi:flagellar motor component MotA
MSKYLGIVIGIIAVFLGIKGLITWHSDLGALLRGSLPLICVLGGAIAVVAGLSEIKDEISSKKEAKK